MFRAGPSFDRSFIELYGFPCEVLNLGASEYTAPLPPSPRVEFQCATDYSMYRSPESGWLGSDRNFLLRALELVLLDGPFY